MLTHFDMTLIKVVCDNGLEGYGEAKAAVGTSGVCASIVSCIENELKPSLLGQDPRNITRIWEMMYNGTRDHYALSLGRAFPILGRRGLTVSAMSGIDMALWDILGKSLNVPVLTLMGGACRDKMEVYASGGWADVKGIGEQLQGYVNKGFMAVKMRVGVMDKTVEHSIARVNAAREILGPEIKIMADAHGTFSTKEAMRFLKGVEDAHLYWFEEPVNSDSKEGCREVRVSSSTPIAAGESEFTRFDIKDLIEKRAVDVIQPDAAIIGGITEAMRVSALAQSWQLELAPHCWGSALSFQAGVSLAFASPAARIIEFSLGGNPMMYELVEEDPGVENGEIKAPDKPGLGLTINPDFVEQYKQ